MYIRETFFFFLAPSFSVIRMCHVDFLAEVLCENDTHTSSCICVHMCILESCLFLVFGFLFFPFDVDYVPKSSARTILTPRYVYACICVYVSHVFFGFLFSFFSFRRGLLAKVLCENDTHTSLYIRMYMHMCMYESRQVFFLFFSVIHVGKPGP